MSVADSQGLSLELERRFQASPQRVFEAWTSASQLEQWFGPPGVRVESAQVDPVTGGSFRICMLQAADRQRFEIRGTFLEIESGRRLVFTWTVESPGSRVCNTRISVDFLPDGEGTHLRLLHELLVDERSREEQRQLIECCLQQLGKFLG